MKSEILEKVDHTLLKQTATWEEIKKICDDAIKYKTASVCIPPCFVKQAKEYVKDKMKVCTVIGFPNGYNTTKIKMEETKEAIKDGADEIDMVINIGMLKEANYDGILSEINEIKAACDGRILKVIIETCLLTDDEKIEMCKIVTRSNADFIKTSTGFSEGGATFDDIDNGLLSVFIEGYRYHQKGRPDIFKNLSEEYREGLFNLTKEIAQGNKVGEIKRIIRRKSSAQIF